MGLSSLRVTRAPQNHHINSQTTLDEYSSLQLPGGIFALSTQNASSREEGLGGIFEESFGEKTRRKVLSPSPSSRGKSDKEKIQRDIVSMPVTPMDPIQG